MNKIILGDCLEVMRGFADNQFDLVLTDPPYGITANKWDNVVDFMGEALRVAPLVVLTAGQPYSSRLVMENLKDFRHEYIWIKSVGSNFANLKTNPMKEHEQVLVFGKLTNYNPQSEARKGSGLKRIKSPYITNSIKGGDRTVAGKQYTDLRHPSSVQSFNNRLGGDRGMHPTQKPVKLMNYLIRTYTNEGDIILDPFAGSGSTLVAAQSLNRNYIGIEINPDYVKIAEDRLKQEVLL